MNDTDVFYKIFTPTTEQTKIMFLSLNNFEIIKQILFSTVKIKQPCDMTVKNYVDKFSSSFRYLNSFDKDFIIQKVSEYKLIHSDTDVLSLVLGILYLQDCYNFFVKCNSPMKVLKFPGSIQEVMIRIIKFLTRKYWYEKCLFCGQQNCLEYTTKAFI